MIVFAYWKSTAPVDTTLEAIDPVMLVDFNGDEGVRKLLSFVSWLTLLGIEGLFVRSL
ncbi:hypothetical protein BDW_04640 [Bdellovibrio bacteriovorus W]|nr:hypothetical protein BDW_04640 [Bdellovibrio bacteriovorus W]